MKNVAELLTDGRRAPLTCHNRKNRVIDDGVAIQTLHMRHHAAVLADLWLLLCGKIQNGRDRAVLGTALLSRQHPQAPEASVCRIQVTFHMSLTSLYQVSPASMIVPVSRGYAPVGNCGCDSFARSPKDHRHGHLTSPVDLIL